MTSADDEIQSMLNTWRELVNNVPSTLASRGWACVNPQAGDGETIEWIWPPARGVALFTYSAEKGALTVENDFAAALVRQQAG